jgi:hypothetical protein
LRASAIALAGALVLAPACSGGHGSGDRSKIQRSLRPEFEPATSTTTAVAGATTTTALATTTSVAPRSTTATTVTSNETSASITDRTGDVTTSLERPPAWADLLGARLIDHGTTFELRVRLGGGTAPTSSDDDHTMNVASFYDVDGDGKIDYEVWANIASSGWGSSYFDDVHGGGRFQEKSGVTVTPDGDEVVLRFPTTHLHGATRFRWSVASEWGRPEALGTLATARDSAPDDDPDGAADFPSP